MIYDKSETINTKRMEKSNRISTFVSGDDFEPLL